MIASESHVPVLVLLSLLRRIERALELGPGRFTTPVFMNADIFPHLTQFDVLENGDEEYCQMIRAEFFSAPRPGHALHYSTAPIATQVAQIDLDVYDLILVDDSVTPEARIDTIKYVTAAAARPLLVIHDFELPFYRDAVSGSRHAHVFTHATPHTAVLAHEPLDELAAYDELITASFADLKADGPAWLDYLSTQRAARR